MLIDYKKMLESGDSHELELSRLKTNDPQKYESTHKDQAEASKKNKKKKGKASRIVKKFRNVVGGVFRSSAGKKKTNNQSKAEKEENSKVKFELSRAESDCKDLTEALKRLSLKRDMLKSELHKQEEIYRSEKSRFNENFEKTDHMKNELIVQLEETISALKRDLAIAEERAKTAETENVQLQQNITELENERDTLQILLNRNTAAVIESGLSRRPVTEL